MNTEILKIAEFLKDEYRGEPWYGKSLTQLLDEVDEALVFEKPNGQHSMLELLWHMVNWRQFTINRLRSGKPEDVKQFEENDWQPLNPTDKSLWKKGLELLHQTQPDLVAAMEQQQDALLDERVEGRNYNYRTLLNGIIQHDIYHLGQIAYLFKLLKNK